MIIKEEGFLNEHYIYFPIQNFSKDLFHPLINGNFPTELGFYPFAKHHYKERREGINEIILLYCVSGVGYVQVNEKKSKLTEKTAICIPKNTPHQYYADNNLPWSIYWLHFSLDKEKLYPFSEGKISILTQERHTLIERDFLQLFSLCEKEYQLSNAICISQLLLLLLSKIYFLADFQVTDQQNILLDKGIRYLNDHLKETITLNDLSKHLKISVSYVSLIFHKYLKKGPIDYLIDLRMELACKLLRTSELKTYEIAKKVGYLDPYYFSRLFKKKIGLSPKDFKNTI